MTWKAALTLCLAALVLFSLCPAAGALRVNDATGRPIDIATPAERVVFLSLYELIPVFDVWDRVAGLNRWAYDSEALKGFARIREIPSVGTSEALNVETLLAIKPDLVITWSYRPEVAGFLVKRGLKVISVYPDSMEDLFAVLELCGKVFEKEDRAREVRTMMEAGFARTASRVAAIPERERRRVLWLWQKPTIVTGGTGLQHDLIRIIGAVNPAEGLKTKHPEVSMESILSWNPDVVFIWGSARFGAEDLLSSSQWKSVNAVKEGRVFKAPSLTTWSPAINSLALWMAWKTYPEYFDRAELIDEAARFEEKCFGTALGGFRFD